jgi:DNA-binding transcriptional LysR family regulator
MSFDLILIRRFEAVARLGGFSRAADELGMTHSAITKSIRTLEDSWGVRLFERTTRSITPTAAGRRLIELAPELLSHAEEGKARVLAAGRRLSIVCGPAIMDSFIPTAVLAFAGLRSDIGVEVEYLPPDMGVQRLQQHRAQLLLYHSDSIAAFAARRDLKIQRVIGEPYHFLCSPTHPAVASREPHTLLQYDWAIAGFDPGFAANLAPESREALQRAGFPRFRLSSQRACLELARHGAVLTMAPRSAALKACAEGGLVSFDMPGTAPFSISSITLAQLADEAAVDFIQTLTVTAHA